MNRRKIGKTVLWLATAAVSGAAVAFVARPGARAPSASERGGDAYEGLKPFSEAFAYIQNRYVDREKTDAKELLHGAVRGMLQTLDPFSLFLTPQENREMRSETQGIFEGIGIEIGVKDRKVVVISPIDETPAHRAGLKAGDWIMRVDGEYTEKLSLSQVIRKIRGEKNTKVTLGIWREGFGEPADYAITRGVIKLTTVRSALLEEGIGYLRLIEFMDKTPADLERQLTELSGQGVRALVVDVRNNPGGLLNVAAEVTRFFIGQEKLIVYTAGRNPSEERRFLAEKKAPYAGVPMVVLVNGGSASASEILAGAVQDHERGVLLGTRTFGKGSVQQLLELSDRSALRLTTAKYYTPKGRAIHNVGIEPDIVFEAPARAQSVWKIVEGDWFAKYAREYVVRYPQGIPEPKRASPGAPDAPSPEEIELERRRIEEQLLREFLRYLRQGGVEVTDDAAGSEREFLLDQLRIEVTRKLKGDREAYRATVRSDPQVRRALELLRTAKVFKKLL